MATIETKFNVGEEVWIMYENRPLKGRVDKININIYRATTISYVVLIGQGAEINKYESKIFNSKEELLASL